MTGFAAEVVRVVSHLAPGEVVSFGDGTVLRAPVGRFRPR